MKACWFSGVCAWVHLMSVYRPDVVYYKNSGKVDYCRDTEELLGDKQFELSYWSIHRYDYFYDAILEIVYNTNKGEELI